MPHGLDAGTEKFATPVVYRDGPVEFDRVVPASGNLAVRGKQFWLGPARAWITVTFPQSALNVSPGARAHYDQQRHRGLGHEPPSPAGQTGWSASARLPENPTHYDGAIAWSTTYEDQQVVV